MRVVHILRKPCSESTVAANVLRHGTGAVNVDATRVSVSDADSEAMGRVNSPNSVRFVRAPFQRNAQGFCQVVGTGLFDTRKGRWPANLVLQHLDGCRRVGEIQVRSDGHYPASRPKGSEVSGPSGHRGQTDLAERHLDGETVTAWSCDPGCPVAALDEQSGVKQGKGAPTIGGTTRRSSAHIGQISGQPRTDAVMDYGDTGGASRFFKQFGGSEP